MHNFLEQFKMLLLNLLVLDIRFMLMIMED
ncbi:MAG TPA: hypothetical protein [Caudoviricetes sp.]|nr:MAG TPA: hypothetical protein [Caudoviricetes sp.]